MVGALEAVGLPDRAIGLDDDHGAWGHAYRFHRRRAKQEEAHYRLEHRHAGTPIAVPAIKDRDEPVSGRGMPRLLAASWRWRLPGSVRQLKVDGGRVDGEQRLVGRDRIVAHVDRAQ